MQGDTVFTSLHGFLEHRFSRILERAHTCPSCCENLVNMSLTDAHLEQLLPFYKSGSWKKLWLSYNRFTNKGLVALCDQMEQHGCVQVEEMCLTANQFTLEYLQSHLCPILPKCENLRVLDLGDLGIHDELAMHLVQGLKLSWFPLEKLSLANSQITDTGLTALCDAIAMRPTMRCFKLSSGQASDQGAVRFTKAWTSLHQVDVRGRNITITDEIRLKHHFMATNPEVQHLFTLVQPLSIPRMSCGTRVTLLPVENVQEVALMLFGETSSITPKRRKKSFLSKKPSM